MDFEKLNNLCNISPSPWKLRHEKSRTGKSIVFGVESHMGGFNVVNYVPGCIPGSDRYDARLISVAPLMLLESINVCFRTKNKTLESVIEYVTDYSVEDIWRKYG